MRRLFSRALLGALLGTMAWPTLSVSALAAQSVALAHGSIADSESSGPYRWAKNFLNGLQAKGWKTVSFATDSIGGEDERLDQIRVGILDVTMSDFASAAQFAPEMRVLQLPFTFSNTGQVFRYFTQSKLLDEINAELAVKDIRLIAIVPDGGFQGIFNTKKPIHTVADMDGLRMSAFDQDQLAMLRIIGVPNLAMHSYKVSEAVWMDSVDGYIGAPGGLLASEQADLFKHYTDAKVTISLRLALASKSWWDGLSAAEQYDVRNAALDASRDVFEWTARTEQTQEDQLTAVGIAVYTPSAAESAGFHNATLGLHQTLKGVSLERVEAILSAIDSYGE